MVLSTRASLAMIVVFTLTTGCATNWNKRIGTYTYEDAKREFKGAGTREDLSNGEFKVSWVTDEMRMWWYRTGGPNSNVFEGMSPPGGSPVRPGGTRGCERWVTELTFTEKGILVAAVELLQDYIVEAGVERKFNERVRAKVGVPKRKSGSGSTRLYIPPEAEKASTRFRDASLPSVAAGHGRLIFYTLETFPKPLSAKVMGNPNGVLATLRGRDVFVIDLPPGWFAIEELIDVVRGLEEGRKFMTSRTVFTFNPPVGFGISEGKTVYLNLIHSDISQWKGRLAEESPATQECQDLVYSGYYEVGLPK